MVLASEFLVVFALWHIPENIGSLWWRSFLTLMAPMVTIVILPNFPITAQNIWDTLLKSVCKMRNSADLNCFWQMYTFILHNEQHNATNNNLHVWKSIKVQHYPDLLLLLPFLCNLVQYAVFPPIRCSFNFRTWQLTTYKTPSCWFLPFLTFPSWNVFQEMPFTQSFFVMIINMVLT